MVLNNTCECIYTLRKKCICTCACAPMQRCRSFFAKKAIANLSWVLRKHRAGCRLPPALLPAQQDQSPDAVHSRNSSKSTLAHDVVSAAVLHKHHHHSGPLVQVSSTLSISHNRAWSRILPVCVLLCFIKPILGIRHVRSRSFIVSEPRETSQKSIFAIFCTS